MSDYNWEQSIDELCAEIYKRGRQDAIDEMVKRINSRKGYFEEYYPNDAIAIAEANVYLEIAKKIKEQKE